MRIKQRLLSGIIAGFYALYSVQMVNAASLPSYENEMVPAEEIDGFSQDEAEEPDDLSKNDVEDISIPEESEPEEQLLESQTANPYEENLILNYRGEDEISVSRIEDQIQTYSRQMATGGTSYTSPYITSVKNQNPYGTCWAHAAIASAEANMVKKGLADSSVDLSEYQLAYFMYHPVNDSMGGLTGDSFTWKTSKTGVEGSYLNVGGNQQLVTYHIASWQGLSDEASAPYSVVKNDYTAELADDYAYGYDVAHLENAYWISMEDKAQVKQAIKEYGAVASSYYHDASYFNVSNYWYATGDVAEYCPASEHTGTNHAVTIVGWDDNFSKEKFSSTYRPSGNGAWFCKNSWGEGFGQEGYFWISYEDAPLLSGEAYVYDMGKADNYDHNYQYDGAYGSAFYKSTCKAEANVYTATSNQTLKAVGFYTADSLYQYTVKIYTDCEDGTPIGTLMSTKEGSQLYAGFHTVVLDTPVILDTGDKFSVVIEQSTSDGSLPDIYVDSSSTASWFTAVSSAKVGQSYVSASGTGWQDISKDDMNCRIKAYTDDRDASAPTYRITVSNGSANVSKAKEGTTVTITAADYPNATFEGWETDSEGVTFVDKTAKVTTFVMPGHSVELRAKFGVQITFDANGHGTAPASQTVTYGGTVTKPANPSAEGYSFEGWYQEASCTNAWNFNTAITSNKTLYAKWTPKQYTVAFNMNGHGTALASQIISYGGKAVKPTDPSAEGYIFGGWYKEPACSNEWNFNTPVTGNQTLYAKWTIKQYTITWVDGNENTLKTEKVNYGVTPAYTGTTPTKAKTAQYTYTFNGNWSPSIKAATSNATYTAQFDSTVNTYTVTYDINGHGTAPAAQMVLYGAKTTKPTDPSATGYIFGGWYKEPACSNAWDFNTAVTGNQTLYAKWMEDNSYQYVITWVGGNGNTLKTEVVDQGVIPSYTGTVPTKAKTAQYTYTFNGTWSPSIKAAAGNATYTAQFSSKVNQYTVSYNANGHGTAPSAQTAAYGAKVSKPADPSATGYVFGGWYKEASCTNAWNFSTNTVTGNQTLYAKWTVCTHTYGAWTVTKEATTSSTGTRIHTCTVCGNTETEELAKLNILVSSITLNSSKASVECGESLRLTAAILPENATNKNVTWRSTNTNIAVVSNIGVVTGKAEGTATIVCTAADGSGKSASCTVKVTDYTQTEAFAARLYEKCLGREPENAGLEYWDELLENKERSGAQVAYGFIFSEEYKQKKTTDEEYVEMLYEVFMNRPSDAGGKANWLDVLSTGVSREYVFRGFAESQEYTNICNSYGIIRGNVELGQARDQNPKLTAYVNRMYTKALGRNGEENGLNDWCTRIQTGNSTPEQVAESFINSLEFQNKHLNDEEYIKVLYRAFMGREYDQEGLKHWLNQLRKGSSREDILHFFATSREFKNIQAEFGL